MKSLLVHPTNPITTTVVDVNVPTNLGPDEILVEVRAAASNPKDWIHLLAKNESFNTGDDLAGIVARIGEDVTAFRVGQRVAALHCLGQPFGAYAHFAVVPAHTTHNIPDNLSFEEASTIPLVSMTAALTLFRRQHFTAPWLSQDLTLNRRPLLIYAASTVLGVNIVKLAKLSGIGPLIAIGGGSSQYVKSLLGDEDIFLDYRVGMDKLSDSVRTFTDIHGLRLENGIDAANKDKSWVQISQMLHGGLLSVFSGAHSYDEPDIPHQVEIVYTYVGSAHHGAYKPGMPKQPCAEDVLGDVNFATDFCHWLDGFLATGRFDGHPYEVIPGGLAGVAEGLNRLRNGQSKGKKLVYQINSDVGPVL